MITPDRWVVVEMTLNGDVRRKVFSGDYGGYLSGDSWKISSEIKNIQDNDRAFDVVTESGSEYHLVKTSYGMSMYMTSIFEYYQDIMTKASGSMIVVDVFNKKDEV